MELPPDCESDDDMPAMAPELSDGREDLDYEDLPPGTDQPCMCRNKCYVKFPREVLDKYRADMKALPFDQRQSLQFDKVRLHMLDGQGNLRWPKGTKVSYYQYHNGI